jgi:hypothetical protein
MIDRAARLTAFASLGSLGLMQDLSRQVMQSIPNADAEVVAEETLALVAVSTARAAEVGFQALPEAGAAAAQALLSLPFLYRDYLIGGAMLTQNDPELAQAAQATQARLERKMEFYSLHLPPGQFPGTRTLADKLPLWMGRVSGPGLPEMPQERLETLGSADLVLTHLKLVLGMARQEASEAQQATADA